MNDTKKTNSLGDAIIGAETIASLSSKKSFNQISKEKRFILHAKLYVIYTPIR